MRFIKLLLNLLPLINSQQTDCDICLERQMVGENIACPEYCNMNSYMIPPPTTDIDCHLQQPSCDNYNYVCPKITEITNCNLNGIDGYTTFRLSLVVKPNMNIKNIYAIYGDDNNLMYLPPAYQSDMKINSNIGGINPVIQTLNSDSMYDSWLTIGITDGNKDNKLGSVGIDFDNWNQYQGININNGAVFVLDPSNDIIDGNEYMIGQITTIKSTNPTMIVNVQGKTINTHIDNSWSENNIRFDLISPEDNNHLYIPPGCNIWYDGCNRCNINNNQLTSCTKLMCFSQDSPRCLSYNSYIGH